MHYRFAPILAFALAGALPLCGAAAVTGPVEFTIASAGDFAVWYAEGGMCSPDPGPHWQMSSNDRHAGVGSTFHKIGHVLCSTYYVHHFDVFAEGRNHETLRCRIVFRGGRLHLLSGSATHCVISDGATFLRLH